VPQFKFQTLLLFGDVRIQQNTGTKRASNNCNTSHKWSVIKPPCGGLSTGFANQETFVAFLDKPFIFSVPQIIPTQS
jgi:hypothetical protein